MPGVPPRPDRRVVQLIGEQIQLTRSLAKQQQDTITNTKGQAVIEVGMSPGSDPPQYGYQLVDPSTGAEIGFLGEDGAGTTALKFRDASGNVIVQIDVEGIHIYDDTGTEQARFGVLNASPAIYGAGVLPYGGSELQMLAGVESYAGASASNVTNTSWVTFGSAITTLVGPSGLAKVSVQSYLATGTGGEQAFVGVQLDGGTVYGFLELSSGAGGISGTVGSSATFTGLSTGTHTFQLAYKTAANGSSNCSFSAASISVEPK